MDKLLLLLVAISGWCWSAYCARALLRAKRCQEALHAGLRAADATAVELNDLLSSLLDRRALACGNLAPKLELVDFALLVDEVAEEFKELAQARGLSLLALPARAPVRALTDRVLLRKVLRDLVSNALALTSAGGVTLSVRTGLRSRFLAVMVTDSGAGLSQEQCAALFSGHAAAMSLPLTRSVARALGGDITVDSTLLMGSTFTVWVPSRLPDTPFI